MSEYKENHDTPPKYALRQWSRLATAYLMIPLMLFICGGDWGWWQAWFYAPLIILIGIGGRVWAEWRHPGLTATRQDRDTIRLAKTWDKVLAPLMALSIAYPTVIVAGLDHRYDWSPDFPVWVNIIGFCLILPGYAFAAWAVAENRFFYSVVCIRKDQGHRVCESGPYRVLRHPGYAGNIYALFGIALALGTLWALIPAIAATIVSIIRTALEDRALQQDLPGYTDYARRVRYRLFPMLY